MFNIIEACAAGPFIHFLCSDPIAGAAGSHDDTTLRLDFSPHWADYDKKIMFFDALGDPAAVISLTEEMRCGENCDCYDITIPATAKAVDGDIRFTVKGVQTEDGAVVSTVYSAPGMLRVLPVLWSPEAEESGVDG